MAYFSGAFCNIFFSGIVQQKDWGVGQRGKKEKEKEKLEGRLFTGRITHDVLLRRHEMSMSGFAQKMAWLGWGGGGEVETGKPQLSEPSHVPLRGFGYSIFFYLFAFPRERFGANQSILYI